MKFKFWFAALAMLGCTGCGQSECNDSETGCNELANKHEFSVLEASYARLEGRPQEKRYILMRIAGADDLTVLALPLRDQDTGYATMLANAKIPPKDKVMGGPFVITSETLAEIRQQTKLTPEIDAMLSNAN